MAIINIFGIKSDVRNMRKLYKDNLRVSDILEKYEPLNPKLDNVFVKYTEINEIECNDVYDKFSLFEKGIKYSLFFEIQDILNLKLPKKYEDRELESIIFISNETYLQLSSDPEYLEEILNSLNDVLNSFDGYIIIYDDNSQKTYLIRNGKNIRVDDDINRILLIEKRLDKIEKLLEAS